MALDRVGSQSVIVYTEKGKAKSGVKGNSNRSIAALPDALGGMAQYVADRVNGTGEDGRMEGAKPVYNTTEGTY